MSKHLNPCPLCCGEAVFVRERNGFRIACTNCDIGMPADGVYMDQAIAVKLWNDRPTIVLDDAAWDEMMNILRQSKPASTHLKEAMQRYIITKETK